MRLTLFIATLVAAACMLPFAANARADDADSVQIVLHTPVNFQPMPDCPTIAAVYSISLRGLKGSGENCIGDEQVAPCPPDSTADYCLAVMVQVTLSLPSGTIVSDDGTIFESWTCASVCNVDQRWSGTVTSATRRFHDYVGGALAGGGLLAFDATTFDLVHFDESLSVTKQVGAHS